ncbi:hypothetical protein ACVBEQ_22445 [Nakamurella sp. GG22]
MSRSLLANLTFRSRALWTLGFLAFPVAGIAGGIVAGPVNSPAAALLGGIVTGAVIGAGQWLASRRQLEWIRWIPATAAGMGLGLLAGAVAVDFGTSLADLALMGAVTGLALGGAQAVVLPVAARRRWIWAAALPALWALGWTVTTAAGVDVEAQYTVFGATGASTVSALSGVLLLFVLPRTSRIAAGSAA